MKHINNSWLKTGFVDEPMDANFDFKSEILKLKNEKNVLIMAHYYQNDEIQDIADVIGDSLALAQKAVDTSADIIMICGVQFMGETAKLLNPGKKVLISDLNATGTIWYLSSPTGIWTELSQFNDFYAVYNYGNYLMYGYENTPNLETFKIQLSDWIYS